MRKRERKGKKEKKLPCVKHGDRLQTQLLAPKLNFTGAL